MGNEATIGRYLETQTEVISRFLPELQHSSGGKAVHEVRVATRRARAALWCSRHGTPSLRFKRLDRELCKLGKALGSKRELDVAVKDSSHFGVDHSSICAYRKKAKKKLKKVAVHAQKEALTMQLAKAQKQLQEVNVIKLQNAIGVLEKKLKAFLRKKSYSQENLHELRIVLKKVRYSFELMGKHVEPLKHLQDLLGDAHDLEILQKWVGRVSRIKFNQRRINRKARNLVKPVLHFAIDQLSEHESLR